MREAWRARLSATVARVERELGRTGRLRPGAACVLEPAPGFVALLERAVADEEQADPARAAQLEQLYLDTMPALRVAQARDGGAPIGALFHRPLDWDALPVLRAAMARVDAAALVESCPTLDALCWRTHYGGFLPLLYAYPGDLARAGRLLDGGASVEAVIERLFVAPLVHELCHFQRERSIELPLYLDEAIAAYLGVQALPAMAFPDDDGTHGLFGATLLYPVGQWFARLFGGETLRAVQRGASARAHLGGDVVDRLAAFGWADYLARRPLHLLSDNYDPQRWCRVLAGLPPDAPWSALPPLPLDEQDFAMLDAALRAMCLVEAQDEGTFVVRRAPSGPIEIDLDACEVRGGARLFGQRARYLLSPFLAAALREAGQASFALPSLTTEAIGDEVGRIRRLVLP